MDNMAAERTFQAAPAAPLLTRYCLLRALIVRLCKAELETSHNILTTAEAIQSCGEFTDILLSGFAIRRSHSAIRGHRNL